MGQLEGKVAIVTGGGSGIGEAMARAMAAEGATVVVSDVSGGQDAVAESIGAGATAMHANVSIEDDVRALIDHAVQAHGRLDVLCNNAGIDGDITPLAECSVEAFDEVIAVNLRGVFLGLRYGIPAMLANGGGSIINTASVAAFVAFQGAGPYCGAKAGVVGLTRAAAAEYSAAGVRVNALCPGVVRTAMLVGLEKDAPELFAQVNAGVEQMSASKRIAEPEEIASAAVFLAGDGASFITGTALVVDGGWTVM